MLSLRPSLDSGRNINSYNNIKTAPMCDAFGTHQDTNSAATSEEDLSWDACTQQQSCSPPGGRGHQQEEPKRVTKNNNSTAPTNSMAPNGGTAATNLSSIGSVLPGKEVVQNKIDLTRELPTSSEHDSPDERNRPKPSSNLVQCSIPNAVTVNLKTEADRLRTFHDWPAPFIQPKKLAAAGFYYFKKADLVRCVFCNLEIGKWQQGDDPMRDHLQWRPQCPFLKNPSSVGNVPLGEERAATSANSSSMLDPLNWDTCGPYGIEVRPNSGPENGLNKQSLAQFGIHKSAGPIHKSYSTIEARLRSFTLWPVSLKQKPDVLSDAGFYYTGKGDQTICFHCGVGLKDWVETDDPWVEHALWASKCTYVILRKGVEFIKKVHTEKQAKLTSKEAEELEKPTAPAVTNAVAVPAAGSGTPMETEDPSGGGQNEGRLCKICFTEELGVLFLPCGHIVACVKCAPSLSICAVCRQPFTATVRAYLP